jgi:leucyl aminopeptidase
MHFRSFLYYHRLFFLLGDFMEFLIKQSSTWQNTKTDCLVIPVYDHKNPADVLKQLDAHSHGLVSRLHKARDIHLNKGKITLVHNPVDGNLPRLLFIGCGKTLDIAGFREVIKALARELHHTKVTTVHVLFDLFQVTGCSTPQLLQQAANLLESLTYKYDETLSKKASKHPIKKITLFCQESNVANKKAVAQGVAMGNGINFAKHLGNLPPNICTPTFLANEALELAKKHQSLKTKILNESDMKKLKMFSLLSVTAGTEEPAKFIIVEYKGGKAGDKPYVLVGKGVTFDSGGISLKPGPKMDEMKYDMCGAASVLGTIQAVAELALKINVIVVVPAVENLPSGKATKPGDVITSMSGQTIEVLNTDAEGRLILCDALTYVERFNPKTVIDVATLTGACVVALGKHASGLYSNKNELSQQLVAAGENTYDRAWPMPLWEEYNQQLHSRFADIANIGGPEGGSVTAACFLSRFTKKYDWAHLDIAGSAWDSAGPKGATGRPVSLLTQYLIDRS